MYLILIDQLQKIVCIQNEQKLNIRQYQVFILSNIF